MKQTNDTLTEEQGSKVANYTKEQITKWLKADLQTAYTLMVAISKDDSMIDLLADYFLARHENSKHQQEGDK